MMNIPQQLWWFVMIVAVLVFAQNFSGLTV